MRRLGVRRLPHRYLRALVASITCDRRLVLGLTNRVGMVRREDDRLDAVGSRGGPGKGGILLARYAPARITRRREVSMRGGCARRTEPSACSCVTTCPGRSRTRRLSMG